MPTWLHGSRGTANGIKGDSQRPLPKADRGTNTTAMTSSPRGAACARRRLGAPKRTLLLHGPPWINWHTPKTASPPAGRPSQNVSGTQRQLAPPLPRLQPLRAQGAETSTHTRTCYPQGPFRLPAGRGPSPRHHIATGQRQLHHLGSSISLSPRGDPAAAVRPHGTMASRPAGQASAERAAERTTSLRNHRLPAGPAASINQQPCRTSGGPLRNTPPLPLIQPRSRGPNGI